MTSENRLAELTAFENVLDTFGGNSARWPAEQRKRFEGLTARDADARRLLKEARAFDAMLDKAAGPPVGDSRALADRIAAAVANSAPHATPAQPMRAERGSDRSSAAAENPSGVVIAWPRAGEKSRAASGAAGGAASQAPPLTGATPRRERVTSGWRTAALLAASLVAGIFVGVADLVPSDVTQFVSSMTDDPDRTSSALAFLNGEGLLESLEEDLL